MANVTVAGKYSIVCKLPFGADGTAAAYEFTGNNRAASFTASIPIKVLATVCTSSDLNGGYAAFSKEADLVIKRARLNAEGAEGLNCSPGELAGRFYLGLLKGATGFKPDGVTLGEELDAIKLTFKNWGEWVEMNGVLRPYINKSVDWSDTAPDMRICRLAFYYQNSAFTCDDYNVNAPYVGEALTPTLELEVSCPGIFSSSDGSIY